MLFGSSLKCVSERSYHILAPVKGSGFHWVSAFLSSLERANKKRLQTLDSATHLSLSQSHSVQICYMLVFTKGMCFPTVSHHPLELAGSCLSWIGQCYLSRHLHSHVGIWNQLFIIGLLLFLTGVIWLFPCMWYLCSFYGDLSPQISLIGPKTGTQNTSALPCRFSVAIH